jgi:ribonuclease VapC
MVIDSSAVLAILKVEAEAGDLIPRLNQACPRRLFTATLLKTRLVMERQIGEAGQGELDRLLAAADITTVPLEATQLHWALVSWRRFGKGHHRAGLNFGDLFSHGLARALVAPLLFKGDAFAATDLHPALTG